MSCEKTQYLGCIYSDKDEVIAITLAPTEGESLTVNPGGYQVKVNDQTLSASAVKNGDNIDIVIAIASGTLTPDRYDLVIMPITSIAADYFELSYQIEVNESNG